MKLYLLAHARAGDKGDTSNICVIAYRPEDYERLRQDLTPEKVKAHLASVAKGTVARFELPTLGALNFVMAHALGGGVTRSLALDIHGKCLASVLLDLELGDQ